MKNKNVGYLITGIAVVVGFIIYIFTTAIGKKVIPVSGNTVIKRLLKLHRIITPALIIFLLPKLQVGLMYIFSSI